MIQYTDACNAACSQCGMRATEKFKRSVLDVDYVKKIIDHCAENQVEAISFTGGEPLLYLDNIVELITCANRAGIQYNRTGTNGFLFWQVFPERRFAAGSWL